MSSQNISSEYLRELFLRGTPLIDVRAPVEFEQGSLPNSVNLPILNNDERALVGMTYKKEGNEAAVRLGHQLISGDVKEERIQKWITFITKNPSAVLYCFRGGQRSQITQRWLREAGVDRPLIVGGYKRARQFLMDSILDFASSRKVISVIGPTGSGKTQFLEEIQSFYPTIHLETIARHRGSAFGEMIIPQPTQIDFENHLAVSLLTIESIFKNTQINYPLVEDESRLIGKCILPEPFFALIHNSPGIWIDESLESRVQHIFQEYILNSAIGTLKPELALPQFAKYKSSLQNISRKLGGLRTKEVQTLLEKAETDFIETKTLDLNHQWIEKLLVYYYDPLYLRSIDKRNVKVIFKGSRAECITYIKSTLERP